MKNHTGSMILLTVFIIPILTLAITFYINYTMQGTLYPLIGIFFGSILAVATIFLVFIVSSFISVGVKVGFEHKVHVHVKRMILLAFLRAIIFTIGFIWILTSWITNQAPLFFMCDELNVINQQVLFVYVMSWLILYLVMIGLTYATIH